MGGRAADSDEPGFLRAFHDVKDVAEACVALDSGDGYLWLNGLLLGCYREAGLQQALYAPDPLWRTGRNELAIPRLSTSTPALPITDSPELGRLTREPGVSCPAGCRCRNCR